MKQQENLENISSSKLRMLIREYTFKKVNEYNQANIFDLYWKEIAERHFRYRRSLEEIVEVNNVESSDLLAFYKVHQFSND